MEMNSFTDNNNGCDRVNGDTGDQGPPGNNISHKNDKESGTKGDTEEIYNSTMKIPIEFEIAAALQIQKFWRKKCLHKKIPENSFLRLFTDNWTYEEVELCGFLYVMIFFIIGLYIICIKEENELLLGNNQYDSYRYYCKKK